MPGKPSAVENRELIEGILRYLVDHPDAKDTIEGIIKWWLPEGDVEWTRVEVQDTLNFFTSKGWLSKRDIADAQTIYGLSKDHAEAIKNFLREPQ